MLRYQKGITTHTKSRKVRYLCGFPALCLLFKLGLVVFIYTISCYLYFKNHYIWLYNQWCFSASTAISTLMVRWFDNQVTTTSFPLFRVSQMSLYFDFQVCNVECSHRLTSYKRHIATKTHSLITS